MASSVIAQKATFMLESEAECPKFNQASDVPFHLHDPHHDSKRPIFHVMPAKGWASDPCGPIYYKGRYHMFYQHLRQSCQWYWGLCWDHVVSDDLVHWKNLPPAVVPTPGWYDADGCFSGTVEFDPELGVPVIMYTGVYLKTNAEAVAAHGLPPPQHDPGTRFVEKQLAAIPADPDDPDLTVWTKLPTPVMERAPAGLNISCWRDPFCIKRPAAAGGEGDEWVVLLASGIRGRGGAVLMFKSKHWTHGWQFDGLLADGDNNALGIKGQDWECPILARLPDLPSSATLPATAGANSPFVRRMDSSYDSVLQSIMQKMDSCNSTHLLLPKLGAMELKKLGIASTTSSSTGSLLGVAHYQASALGSLTASSTDIASMSGSSTCSASQRAAGASADCLSVSGVSTVSDSNSSSSLKPGGTSSETALPSAPPLPAKFAHAVLPEAADLAAGAASVAAITAAVTASPGENSLLETVPSAPLTEPVLAAATTLAEAENTPADAAHPAVNLYAWLEQTDAKCPAPPATDAAAVTAAKTSVADSNTSSDAEYVVTAVSYERLPSTTLGSSNSLCDMPGAVATAPVTDDGDLVMVIDSPKEEVPCGKDVGDVQKKISDNKSNRNWWFCMSPDACNNPITWWLGEYDGNRFDIEAADGPHRLDLGTTLYAASLWEDPQGRQLLYGWIQEHRRVPTPPNNCGEYQYAGCIGTPRVLHLHNGHLYQSPLPEIDQLRTRVSWHANDVQLRPDDQLLPLQVVSGTHLDINLTFQPPASCFTQSESGKTLVKASLTDSWIARKLLPQPLDPLNPANPRVGLVFKSWRADGQGAAVLSFDWSNYELAVDFDAPFPDAYNPHPEDTPERRRIGGKLMNYTPGTPLSLRVLVDGSVLEVFTSTGETLTTRVYRGHPPKCSCTACGSNSQANHQQQVPSTAKAAAASEDETGIALFAANEAVVVSTIDVWEMGSCWTVPPAALLGQLQQAATPGIVLGKDAAAAKREINGAGISMAKGGVVHHPAGDTAHVDAEFLHKLHISAPTA